MNRREFLILTAGAALARSAGISLADDLPADVKIVRATAFELPSKRVKFVGKNARLDDHGDHSGDRIVRLTTNSGVEGFGVCHAKKEAVQGLLNQAPKPALLGEQNAPIWDLLGNLHKKPAYELLTPLTPGQSGLPTAGPPPRTVAVYDGS